MTLKAKTPQQLIDEVIVREGAYVNHPADRGGPTCWGITEAVARQHGYVGSMKDLPRSQAAAIYYKRYWKDAGLEVIAEVSPRVAEEMFDTGVNMGPHRAATFLQRVINVLNREGKDYPDVKVDGRLGPASAFSLKKLITSRKEGELVALRGLEVLQGAFYIGLAEGRPSQEAFTVGWLTHRISLVPGTM